MGFAEVKPGDAPLTWLALDFFYLGLDCFVAIGLWRRTFWGVGCLLLAIVSQLILYIGFPYHFAKTLEQEKAIQGMVEMHLLTLAIYLLLKLKNY